MLFLFVAVLVTAVNISEAQSPFLISNEGQYLGDLNDNPYDPTSVSNPYGLYGSPYSPDSVNNPYGRNGSEFSIDSPNNDYSIGKAPRIYSSDGDYLGRLSKNETDLDSVSNTYGLYGSPYSPLSINNPYGEYGSPYSQKSSTFIYGSPFFKEQDKIKEVKSPEKVNSYTFSHQENEDLSKETMTQFEESLQNYRKQTELLLELREKAKARILAKEQENKERNKSMMIVKSAELAERIIYYNKEHLIKLFNDGLIAEIRTFDCLEVEVSDLPEDERKNLNRYINIRINDIKKILLSNF